MIKNDKYLPNFTVIINYNKYYRTNGTLALRVNRSLHSGIIYLFM